MPSPSITGTAGNDTLTGSAADDTIAGGGGANLMSGLAGNDEFDITLATGESDTIDGGAGFDTVVIAMTAAQAAQATVQSALGSLARFLATTAQTNPAAHFIDPTLHVDLTGIEAVQLSVGGTPTTLAQALPGPTAVADSYGIARSVPTSISAGAGLLANDKTLIGGLVATAGSVTTALGATVTIAADGSFAYAPGGYATGNDSFGYTVTDLLGHSANGTATLVFPANHAAAIAGTSTGAVVENGILAAAGTLVITDSDPGQASFRAPASLAGTYGSFSFNAATGAWGYTLNNAAANVQALDGGQQVTDSLAVTSFDGTATKPITVSITGTNELPVFGGTVAATLLVGGPASVGGTVTIADPDAGESQIYGPATLPGVYGGFTFSAATDAWTYTLNAAATNVLSLKAGQAVYDSMVLTSFDLTTQQLVLVTILGTNGIATIAGSGTGAVTEDKTGYTSGMLTVTDRNAGEAGLAVPGILTGTYGSFGVSTNGGWSYTLNNAAANVQSLRGGQQVTDSLVVNSIDGTASKTLTVTITGTNDVPVFGGTSTGAVTEDGTLTAAGRLTIADVDTGESSFRAPASLAGAYGSFSFAADTGSWGYTLNNAATNVQSLRGGQVVTDKLVVTSFDGSATQAISIAITGTNDVPVITGSTAGAVAEDGTLTASGRLNIVDRDTGESSFQTPASLAGTYGAFTFNAATGAWGYTLNNAATNVQSLRGGQVVTDKLLVTSFDGTATQGLTVSITGANDPATISGNAAGIVAVIGRPTTAGTLVVTDRDTGESVFQAPASLAGHYGAFAFNPTTGAWGYTLNTALPAVQALHDGQTLADSLTVKSLDGTASQAIGVSITYVNHPASISGSATGAVAEDGTLTAAGQLKVTDPDAGQSVFLVPASLSGVYGTFAFNAVTGAWGYTLNNAADAVQSLRGGQVVTDSLSVTSYDGSATTALTVSITGKNDPASIAGSATGAVAEDGTLVATGQLTVTDRDTGEAVFQTPASLAGTYGAFSFNAATGAWGYALNDAAANVQSLRGGQVVTDSLTVTSLDGTASKPIVVSITGTNDPAAIAGDLGGMVKEDVTLATGGTVHVSDVDTGEAVLRAPTAASLVGTYGSFTLDPVSGVWTYVLNSNAPIVQRLDDGQLVTDSLAVTSLDGTAQTAITVSVYGTNINAEISGTSTGRVTENDQLTAGGTLTVVDPNSGQSAFQPPTQAALTGTYGTFTFDPLAGTWTYTLNDAVQALHGGQAVVDSIRVTSLDGSATQPIVVSILGGEQPVLLGDIAAGHGGFKIIGEHAYDNAGFAVAGIGDLNGDGVPDLLVTAPGNGNYAGAAYVVWGSAAGGTVSLADVAAGHGGFKITGQGVGSETGGAAASAGDVNGDGVPDILLGAPYDGPAAAPTGDAYVVFGKAGGSPVSLAAVAAGTGGFEIIGENAWDQAGASLASIGHLGGPSHADVLVGAPGADAAYVVWGKAGGSAVHLSDVANGIGGYKIIGESATDLAGSSVAVFGDMNGDGRPDLLIGAPGNGQAGDDAGAAYVVWGKAGGTTVNLADVANGTGGFKIVGEAAYDMAGRSVAALGDVNGDGVPDILVGAPNDDANGNGAGAAYVVWGKPGGATVNLADVAAGTGGFKIIGEAGFDMAGITVASVGDLNGDGKADLLISSVDNNGMTGGAYVVWGKSDGTPINLTSVAAGHGGFKIDGEGMGAHAGYALSSVADMNGDGRPDILVSATNDGAAGEGAGAAYVVYSQPDWLGLA